MKDTKSSKTGCKGKHNQDWNLKIKDGKNWRELFEMALGVLNKGFNIDTEMVKRKPELKPF